MAASADIGVPVTISKDTSDRELLVVASDTLRGMPVLRLPDPSVAGSAIDGTPTGRWRITLDRADIPAALRAAESDRLDPARFEDIILVMRYRILTT